MLDKQYPLWLPEGSVRAILALGVVAAFVAGVAELRDIVLVVVGFYFGSRTADKSNDYLA